MKPPPDVRARHRAYLQRVIEHTQTPATTLAQRIGVAPSTLTRAMNDPEHKTALSARTLTALERFSGLPFFLDVDAPPKVFREEAAPFDWNENKSSLADTIKALTREHASVSAWVLTSRSLETLGYIPGDILVVDLNEPTRKGDIVCAQIYDWQKLRAETVFRLFDPPYLLAASPEVSLMTPKLIDGSIGVKGPVIFSLRPRSTS